jgi:hypothetical protein
MTARPLDPIVVEGPARFSFGGRESITLAEDTSEMFGMHYSMDGGDLMDIPPSLTFRERMHHLNAGLCQFNRCTYLQHDDCTLSRLLAKFMLNEPV